MTDGDVIVIAARRDDDGFRIRAAQPRPGTLEAIVSHKKPVEDNLAGIPSHIPDLKPGKYRDGTPLPEVQFLECKITLKPESPHVHEKLSRVREDREAYRRGERRRLHEEGDGAAAADPRGGLLRYRRFRPLQQRVHPAAAHPVRGRVPPRRPGDRPQVPAPGHAEGGRDGRAAAHRRQVRHEVQGRSAAAEGPAGRVPAALLAQRSVLAERGADRGTAPA